MAEPLTLWYSALVQRTPEPEHVSIRWLDDPLPVRIVVATACFIGMLLSMPVWLSLRPFPLLPIHPDWPMPADLSVETAVFWFLLATLVLSIRWAVAFTPMFLIGSVYYVLCDQCRIQPWFYQYWLLLFLAMFRAPAALTGCRLMLSAVYLWAGIQKLNPSYYETLVPWFIQPASRWIPQEYLSQVMPSIRWMVSSAPIIEIFIGVGLWFRSVRWLAYLLCVAVHAAALLFLGPLGHKANLVVWPWNVAMPVLAFILFPTRDALSPIAGLKISPVPIVTVLIVGLLPILSFYGKWDSYLSFALYSGNPARADIFLTDAAVRRIPNHLRPYVMRTNIPFDPERQGSYTLDYHTWAYTVLGVPEPPEPRIFKGIAANVAQFLDSPDDIRVVIKPRHGPIELLRGREILAERVDPK